MMGATSGDITASHAACGDPGRTAVRAMRRSVTTRSRLFDPWPASFQHRPDRFHGTAGPPRPEVYRTERLERPACSGEKIEGGVVQLAEFDATNWREALAVEVRTDQVPFVSDG